MVIQLPPEIDAGNAEEVGSRLRAAYAPGRIIVADMGNVTFCDSLGTRELINVHFWAKAVGCEVRFARPTAPVLRVWQLIGVDRVFAIYPNLGAARRPSEDEGAATTA
jgi:anti-anti-sigma factor